MRYRGALTGATSRTHDAADVLSLLLIEDDPDAAETLTAYFTRAGHAVALARSAEAALEMLRRDLFDAAIVDLSLPGMSGIEFIAAARDAGPPVIVVTGDTNLATVVTAMRAGAADYVTKPLTMRTLQTVLARVVEMARLRQRVDRLERDALDAVGDPDPGASAASQAMREALALVERVAASSTTSVLFVGESGAGKEVLAAHLHRRSPRGGPFVRINVAAIPETMMEAELFGATRGAYTDARRDRPGFFAAAEGGTLLLDEIAEMRVETQAKLLRVIETRRYYPVGGSREVTADVRIVAATNREPAAAVAEGRLRADLYYRLATMQVTVPPLRERVEDIPLLAAAMLQAMRRQLHRGPETFSVEAITALQAWPWPGNVRELRNAVERLAILCDAPEVRREHIERLAILGAARARETTVAPARNPTPRCGPDGAPLPLDVVGRLALEEAERAQITATLEVHEGNRTRAAEALGISRSTLWSKLQRYGLA